jgi:hypothetical protein
MSTKICDEFNNIGLGFSCVDERSHFLISAHINDYQRKSSHSFQEVLEEIKLKEFPLLDVSYKSYRSTFDCLVVSNSTNLD